LRVEHMTGLTEEQALELTALVHEQLRAVGKTGSGAALGLHLSVVMVVALMRQNLTQECAADIFNVSQPTVSRRWNALRDVIAAALDGFAPDPSEAARGCTCLLDGTLVPTWDWKHRTDLYSGKHHTTGFNVQVAATMTGRLLAVGAPLPGSRHDAHAYTASGIDRALAGLDIVADLGYLGLGLTTGTRKPAGGELSEDRAEANRDLSRVRSKIENVISWLKNWKMLSTRYRPPLHTFPGALRAIVGLYHFARS
jgi:DDE superfamily endonuclease/Helix-turn-helix of DDE superfamily endonuclease